jgi:hypothetical protein
VGEELFKGCDDAGIHVIDPRLTVEQVMTQISHSGLLLTEALHGAVCANAIRVPWVSICASHAHDFKWYDWCASLDMVWNPISMEQFTLSWARDNAVPQLSAESVASLKTRDLLRAVERINLDLGGRA